MQSKINFPALPLEELRKRHNLFKRELIQQCVKSSDFVLDCGCGRGGDLQKWPTRKLVCLDPDVASVTEARERAKSMRLNPVFQVGDVRSVTGGPFDVICYNFSLHYIAASPELFEESIQAIVKNLKPGGRLIGIVPDPDRLPCEYFRDRLGNTAVRDGELLRVRLIDGPFYSGTERVEPILHPEKLKENLKMKCVLWEPMVPEPEPTGLISDIYSKFIFVK
jgi:SAM-dependent methyltransferase